ncbi:hypothetical protein SCUCBS95973_000960 [Sporothrix curviconia]|uniref:Uncharacterized protein n=1 Tax=Sporothrix curviconia TaxID=1260050 RepID=A0ABP0AUJ8_9PEZI
MCMYFSVVHFPGCLHVVKTTELPPEIRVVYSDCPNRADDVHRSAEHTCSNITILPDSVSEVACGPMPQITERDLGKLCPQCSDAFVFVDDDWKLLMDVLQRICAHRRAGQLQPANMGIDVPDPRFAWFLHNLVPAELEDLQSLNFQRELAFNTKRHGNVFRLHNWVSVYLYQRLLVHRFLTSNGNAGNPAGDALSQVTAEVVWQDWVKDFGINIAQSDVMMRDIDYLLELDRWLARTLPHDSVIPASPRQVPDWYTAVMSLRRMSARNSDSNSDSNSNNVGSSNYQPSGPQLSGSQIGAWLDRVEGNIQE